MSWREILNKETSQGSLGFVGISEAKKESSLPKVNLRKRGLKCVKLWKRRVILVFGEDITMNKVIELINQALTMCLFGKQISERALGE